MLSSCILVGGSEALKDGVAHQGGDTKGERKAVYRGPHQLRSTQLGGEQEMDGVAHRAHRISTARVLQFFYLAQS